MRGRKLPVVIGVAVGVLVLDLITKLIVVHALSNRPPIRLLDGFLTLLLLRNSGAAFSIGTSMTIVFTAIAAAVIIYILRAARKLRSLPWAITLGLLLGGATGNLADRIFRSPGLFRGDVVDWIELPHWPVFNLADSAIVCGGALAVLLALRGIHLDGTREGEADDTARTARHGGRGSGPVGPDHRPRAPCWSRWSRAPCWSRWSRAPCWSRWSRAPCWSRWSRAPRWSRWSRAPCWSRWSRAPCWSRWPRAPCWSRWPRAPHEHH